MNNGYLVQTIADILCKCRPIITNRQAGKGQDGYTEEYVSEAIHRAVLDADPRTNALCRIADALEKLVPPQFEAPVPIPGTQSLNPEPTWTRCPKCKDHPGYIGESYCDCPIGKDLKRIQTPKAGL